MGGGLMELVSYGAQDVYLTGNPQITFFKVVYRRHTNFSMETIEQTLSGTGRITEYENEANCIISRNGDLIHKIYLTVNDKTTSGITNGSKIIKEVKLNIGGQLIDKYTQEWQDVWNDLSIPKCHSVGFKSMTGNFGKSCINQDTDHNKGVDFIQIPLLFWFCRNPGLSLPLIALQYHDVSLDFIFNTNEIIGLINEEVNINIFVDYIYLDTDERKRFAQVSHEYLIEQLQIIETNNTKIQELNFNHPVKEIIWTSQPTSHGELSSYNNAKLVLNGQDRFSKQPEEYFQLRHLFDYHTKIPRQNLPPSGTTLKSSSIEIIFDGTISGANPLNSLKRSTTVESHGNNFDKALHKLPGLRIAENGFGASVSANIEENIVSVNHFDFDSAIVGTNNFIYWPTYNVNSKNLQSLKSTFADYQLIDKKQGEILSAADGTTNAQDPLTGQRQYGIEWETIETNKKNYIDNSLDGKAPGSGLIFDGMLTNLRSQQEAGNGLENTFMINSLEFLYFKWNTENGLFGYTDENRNQVVSNGERDIASRYRSDAANGGHRFKPSSDAAITISGISVAVNGSALSPYVTLTFTVSPCYIIVDENVFIDNIVSAAASSGKLNMAHTLNKTVIPVFSVTQNAGLFVTSFTSDLLYADLSAWTSGGTIKKGEAIQLVNNQRQSMLSYTNKTIDGAIISNGNGAGFGGQMSLSVVSPGTQHVTGISLPSNLFLDSPNAMRFNAISSDSPEQYFSVPNNYNLYITGPGQVNPDLGLLANVNTKYAERKFSHDFTKDQDNYLNTNSSYINNLHECMCLVLPNTIADNLQEHKRYIFTVRRVIASGGADSVDLNFDYEMPATITKIYKGINVGENSPTTFTPQRSTPKTSQTQTYPWRHGCTRPYDVFSNKSTQTDPTKVEPDDAAWNRTANVQKSNNEMLQAQGIVLGHGNKNTDQVSYIYLDNVIDPFINYSNISTSDATLYQPSPAFTGFSTNLFSNESAHPANSVFATLSGASNDYKSPSLSSLDVSGGVGGATANLYADIVDSDGTFPQTGPSRTSLKIFPTGNVYTPAEIANIKGLSDEQKAGTHSVSGLDNFNEPFIGSATVNSEPNLQIIKISKVIHEPNTAKSVSETSKMIKKINVYSFALKPEEHQPSGSCNFSRIDSAQLITDQKIGFNYNIYAVNYNVLRIMSGMGGLAYSN